MDLFNNIHKIQYFACSILLCSGAFSGCGGEPEPEAGVLVVPFELGNHKDCEAFGITRVRAELDGGYMVEETACSAGQVRFTNLMPGSYEVVMYGLDDDDNAVMDSVEAGERVISLTGDGSTVAADPSVILSAAPARLKLRWNFGFGTCDSAGINTFAVTAWRDDGSELLLDVDLDCNMSGEGEQQYRLVPDADRELGGDEFGEVGIQPIDESDFAIGDPVLFAFEVPGAGHTVRLSLECDDGGCMSSSD